MRKGIKSTRLPSAISSASASRAGAFLLIVVSLLVSAASAQTYSVLHSFGILTNDAAYPVAGLTGSGNTLYGAAYRGGGWGQGAVFSINTDGTGYIVLNSFAGFPDGALPYAELTLSGSTLYGTTSYGGTNESGTVFQLNTDGTAYTVLYNFGGYNDGAEPFAGLTLSGSTLYGTTEGQSFAGTLFKLNTDGTGYTVLKNCTTSGGSNPHAGLTLSGSTLYGTTYYGGTSNYGTVFKLNTDGTGYTVLYNFTNSPDGAYPSAVTLSGSTLFGVTYSGGSSNYGTVFKLNTDGTGYTVLKNFTGSDGGYAYHWGGLTLSGSTLFGTTYSGGSSNYGTVFKIKTDGTGYTVLKNFAYDDGAYPSGVLTLLGSALYGTTYEGGSLNEGVVFSLNLAPVLNITSIPGRVVLSWDDPAFSLQSAPEAARGYTNIPAAASPYTNVIIGGRQFFRLIGN